MLAEVPSPSSCRAAAVVDENLPTVETKERRGRRLPHRRRPSFTTAVYTAVAGNSRCNLSRSHNHHHHGFLRRHLCQPWPLGFAPPLLVISEDVRVNESAAEFAGTHHRFSSKLQNLIESVIPLLDPFFDFVLAL
ncbi:hypothetical protein PIB30_077168 [Stylosanthes scabra]|uniref:Uncharacterized protein n=1 Tax=Stylosanthes scabra TaxID=79078 RepID=A0ABU6XQ99_9FABA|nr:hypothetical protein [Stylosanthes scabra]